ncbi:hypothetical protein M514_00473 [Trichuris suis]|uniref:RalA-binding protein 1-like Ral binding domain-containing protein n=1 Tax=Trichuris suis TaxID=68888 RepID=A0A085NRG9_9BILA|nr:hypothetical protein M514_00473 [Trichuris suis]
MRCDLDFFFAAFVTLGLLYLNTIGARTFVASCIDCQHCELLDKETTTLSESEGSLSPPSAAIKSQCAKQVVGDCFVDLYVSPLKPSHGRSAVELPTDPKAIVEELAKQEFLLSHLHDEIKSGISDPQKEEQLWDVQRLVTQLKRELKALKRRNDSAFVDFDHEPGPCLEMFEEKHLIAVQMELRSKIESEQGAIDQLLCQINELKQCPLSLSVYADPETVSLTPNEEKIWAEKYEELENQKHILTERIISERQKCVSLLAQMEMLSLANQNRKSSSYIGGLQY